MKSRQFLVTGLLVLLLSSRAFGVPKGELRYVFHAPVFPLIRFNVTESLVSVDGSGKYIPRLAESWRWLDERTIEFKLRRGVKFHNGEEFNAHVVVTNWAEYRKNPLNLYGALRIPQDTLVEALNEYTVTFSFPEPDGLALLKIQWFSQLAPESFRKSAWTPGFWGMFTRPGPWGTGPFILSEGYAISSGQQSDRIILVANEQYWNKGQPGIRKIVFLTSEQDRQKALSSVLNTEGVIDFLEVRPTAGLKILQSGYATLIKRRSGSSLFGVFNFAKADGRWRQPSLRKAVNYAINRPALVRFGAKGNALLTGGLIPPGMFGFNKDLSPFPFDPEKAKKLVEESGIGPEAVIRIIHTEYEDLPARVIAKMIEQTGLRVEREKLSYDNLLGRISKWPSSNTSGNGKDWDIVILFMPNWTGSSLVSWDLVCCTTESFIKDIITDNNLEYLWASFRKTVNLETQEELIRQIEKYIRDEAMALFLYAPVHLRAINKNVRVPMDDSLWLYENIRSVSVTERHWSVRKK